MQIEANINHQYLDHFKTQLLYLEVFGEEIKILFDGGGFQDRHELMLELLKRCFVDYPTNKKLKFWIFTGDNRPVDEVNKEPLFSIAGMRHQQDFIIPDPHSLRWPQANVKDFYEYCENITKKSLSISNINPNVIWRGSKHTHPIRHQIIEILEKIPNQNLFDVKHIDVDESDKNNFIEMCDLSKSAILLEMPGRGFSGRIKYLMHACRPLLIIERAEWDHATVNLEPGLHYISTSPDLNFIQMNCQKILKNYEFYLKESIIACKFIKNIMKRKNISKSMVTKIQKYV